MKRFICLTVVLMIILMSLGCATVPETTPTGTQDLKSSVGNTHFVGDPSKDAFDTAYGMSGHRVLGR
jgi:hypothetical protein